MKETHFGNEDHSLRSEAPVWWKRFVSGNPTIGFGFGFLNFWKILHFSYNWSIISISVSITILIMFASVNSPFDLALAGWIN